MSIVVENLSFTYMKKTPFEKKALDGVSLTVFDGEFLGIIGSTGSGKSTLIQHFNGLIKPESGRVVVGDIDLTAKKCDLKSVRQKVGIVFQYPEYQLFDETVAKDIAFGPRNLGLSEEEIDARVRESLALVGLDEDIAEKSPFDLSGGQKRRVAIAGVIVTKPEILVLDEPAAGLDPLGKEEIMGLLHKIHSDWCKTVIVVSHDMDEIAENCTRAAIFSEGKVLNVAEPKQLFADIEALHEKGLDVPFTAKLTRALADCGVKVDNNFTTADFIEKTLSYVKTMGAGMRSTVKGGQNDA